MKTKTKKEVSCKHLSLILIDAKNHNIDINKLLEGTPYDISYVLNKHERVEWKYWCKILSNLRIFYTPLEYERIGREYVQDGNYIEGVLTAFIFFSSNKLARTLAKQFFRIGDSDFTCIQHQVEYLAKNKIRTKLYTKDEYEFCPEFYHLTKGAWDQFGKIIGHKEFNIDVTWIHQGVIFDVSWKKQGVLFKIKRWMRWIFNIKKAVGELTTSHEELLNQYNKLEESKNLLQKQAIQLKTAHNISTAIRQSLNLKDTLETLTNSLVAEAGFTFASVHLLKDLDQNQLEISIQTGILINSASPIYQDVIIDNNKIGQLTVYPKLEMDFRESRELLDYLLPIINISIHDALVLRAIVDYRNNLETKVESRTFELQKARDELAKTIDYLKEAQQSQNRFFTNISHEFRTPLTLILGPAKQLLEKLNDEKVRTKADLIHRSAKKLNRLVDELLDISKIESGEMKLKACPVNIISVVNDIARSFYSLAERKKITFKLNLEVDELLVYVDIKKVDKILTNVLSNAFKFTPEGGQIDVSVIRSFPFSPGNSHSELVSESANVLKKLKQVQLDINSFVEISICDTGIGIPKDHIDKIFNRFYQVDGSHTREKEGTGIGLSLTKELVELHRGRIEVESEPGRGSIFKIIFLLGKDHLKSEEICEEKLEKITAALSFDEFDEARIKNKSDIKIIDEPEKPSLLIVEDNSDVREYIIGILDHKYNILEAKDGEEGVSKSYLHIPDLIISDIMMPKMDGFKLCTKLKSEVRTCHIPIIMLTARATMQDKINGLETGADDYIMKPFEAEELKARIKNLLDQRRKLHEHFRMYGLANIDEKSITSLDQKFLRKAIDVVSKNISDTTFGVEVLAEGLSISRSLLLKKTEALFGESPNELIRRVRLNKAARLIERNFGNISEIALEVGFSNPSYFAECFKKQFGVVPSQYFRKS